MVSVPLLSVPWVELPEEVPFHALETFEERPVTLKISFDVLMGGFTVYRL